MKKVLLFTASLMVMSAGAVKADYDRDYGPYGPFWGEGDVTVPMDAGDRKYDDRYYGNYYEGRWWPGYYEWHWKTHHAKKPMSKEEMVKESKKLLEEAEKSVGEITDAGKKTHAENAVAHMKLSSDQLDKGDEKDAKGNSASLADVKASASKVKALHRASKSAKKPDAKKDDKKADEKKPDAKKDEKKDEKKH